MVPIYFHLASHLWIFYLFIFNGFLIHALLRKRSSLAGRSYSQMTGTFEASLLAAFFISLSLNGILLLILDLLSLNFALMAMVLPAVSVFFLIVAIKSGHKKVAAQLKVDFDWWRFGLYAFVFIILFYNGGLIEQTADSWWHMSLANKIGLASTFNLETGHLTAEATRYYPTLWHANLALANILAGESIPVFWNSFTAWSGVLKVMSFSLFAFALSANRAVAVLSAALFVLLPGLGDSYLRVSAWPSHIAYTAMFCLFYVAFFVVDRYKRDQQNLITSIYTNLLQQKSAVIAFISLAVLILLIHQLEFLLFYIGMLAYLCGLTIYFFLKSAASQIENINNDLLMLMTAILLVAGVAASIFVIVNSWQDVSVNVDWFVACLLVFALFTLLLIMFVAVQTVILSKYKKLIFVVAVIVIALFCLSIDVRHLVSLLKSELAYPRTGLQELPVAVTGLFGGELKLPNWNLQLRSALLYSGLLSIPLSIILLIIKPSRLTLFVCANALTAFLFCISPYLYAWLISVLNYTSPWRIATLIFHPITLAFILHTAWIECIRRKKS